MNDQSVEFKLDLTKLTLYEYKPEPAESEGVSIAKPQTDEHGLMSADFKLDADTVKPHTLVATGTLNYVTDYPEEGQSGNYMLLDITLGSDATNAATVKIGDEVVTINEKTGTVLIKVDSETGDLVITVDYDGEGEDFKATDYTVVTGLLKLKNIILTLNANGGVFSDSSEIQIIGCLKGVTIGKKIEEEPTREGYVFKGWYATAEKANIADDNFCDTENKLTDNLSLYAGWTALENSGENPSENVPV